jgi:teichuronic acid biosynthesis glycosyltransferase TuaC
VGEPMLRVLVVTNMYPTVAEPWFGCFVEEQVQALRRVGLEVVVYSFDGRRKRRAYLRAARKVRKLVRSERFDVVHAHYGLTGAVAAIQRRVPVITTFHGSDADYSAWQALISMAVARTTTPVFVSRRGAERLRARAACVVPTAVDTRLFHPRSRLEARRELGWPTGDRYILLPGASREPLKGGALFENVVAVVRSRADAETNVRTVSLEGFVREAVATVMNAVDIVLMTSVSEGSPVAVKEALACRTPVVSVPVGDVPIVLDGLPGCSIGPREPNALAQAVMAGWNVRDSALRKRAEMYSHDVIAHRIVELYRTVLRRAWYSTRSSEGRAADVA